MTMLDQNPNGANNNTGTPVNRHSHEIIRNKLKYESTYEFDENSASTLAPNYKPRYLLEETTIDENPNHQTKGNFTLSKILSLLGRCFCKCIYSIVTCSCLQLSPRYLFSFCFGSRRRATFLISISTAFCLLLNTFILDPLALSIGNYHSTSLAKRQSFGFFEDIPQERWKLLQKRVHEQRKKQRKKKKMGISNKLSGKVIVLDPSHYNKASEFYQHHWQTDFTCPHEERIGTLQDGGRYLCDPLNIASTSNDRLQQHKGNGCLIYTSSANIHEFKFEKALLEKIGSCDIHVFSPNGQLIELDVPPDGVTFHPWGFQSTSHNNNLQNSNDARTSDNANNELKTFQETLQLLGHCGKTIDVFTLDCEGCEFDLYRDLFDNMHGYDHDHSYSQSTAGDTICIPAALMQVSIQVHGAPSKVTNDFFAKFQDEGYVIFRKDAVLESSGNEQTYGFLKLADSFFKRI